MMFVNAIESITDRLAAIVTGRGECFPARWLYGRGIVVPGGVMILRCRSQQPKADDRRIQSRSPVADAVTCSRSTDFRRQLMLGREVVIGSE